MAVAKDQSVAEKLKLMYELQLVDSELDQIQILKGELPIEVSDLEDEIEGLQTRSAKIGSQLKESEAEVAKHNTNIKDSEANIIRYTKQLDNVKNNREYEALTKEIESQNLEIQLSQKRIREHQVIVQQKQETLTATDLRLTQKRKDLDNKKVELAQIIEKTEKEEEKLNKRIEKARKKIEERLLRAYDKTRRSYRNGLAIVTIERDACGGCFNKTPPQVNLEVGLRKKIIACEHCGRILVDNDILNAHDEIIVAPKEDDAIIVAE
jgi:uncharacterized protein